MFIRFSSRSQFENRIAVINASDAKVAVYPVDITLNIPKAKITIPAVMNFKEYVKMRHTEAKTVCAKSEKPTKCARYTNNIFNHYSEVESFSFGEIPPKDKNNGYFAFDLPDPLNNSKQAKQAKKRLKNSGRVLRGTVRVVVRTVAIDPEQCEFNFPVKVLVSQKGKPRLLKILKYL